MAPRSEVSGPIEAIERGGGSEIVSFTVRDVDGSVQRVWIDPASSYGFDLEHLEVHRRDDLPVRCRVQTRDGKLYAIEILDV
jgi:hypothetical protein